MEVLGFLLLIIGMILAISGATYFLLFVYATRVARKSVPEVKTLLGVVPPKKED